METESSGDYAGKAIQTENIAKRCIKNEGETGTKQNPDPFPTETDELETKIEVDDSSEIHVGNLVKSELVEFDEVDTTDIFNPTSTTMILIEKIPKSETEILGDDPRPSSTSDEEFDLCDKVSFSSDDSASNFDPECDPFADVDCDPSFSKISQSHNTNNFSATTQVQLSNPHEVNSCYETNIKTNETPNCKLKRFKCQLCPSTYACRGGLSQHMQSHKNQRLFKCPMPNCDKAFNFQKVLKEHLSYIHSNERLFKCQEPNCGKTFKINGQLQRHMRLHSEERPFKCPHSDCHKAFKLKTLLLQHVRVHTEYLGLLGCEKVADGPFKCEKCDSAFAQNWQLNMHLKTHAKEIFQCPDPNCNRKFNFKHNCKLHFVNMHQITVPLQCPEPNCGKMLKNKKGLQKHFAFTHRKKDAVSFTCTMPNCVKTFKRKDQLTEHIRYHTRPHVCMEHGCSRKFARPRDLQLHVESTHKNNVVRKTND